MKKKSLHHKNWLYYTAGYYRYFEYYKIKLQIELGNCEIIRTLVE